MGSLLISILGTQSAASLIDTPTGIVLLTHTVDCAAGRALSASAAATVSFMALQVSAGTVDNRQLANAYWQVTDN